MPDAPVEVYNPQGKLGTIPSGQLDQAKTAGYKAKSDYVEVVHPKTGQTGIIPKDQWGDDKKPGKAQTQGYIMSPREQQRIKAKTAQPIQDARESVVVPQSEGAMGIQVSGNPQQVEQARDSLKTLGAVTGGTAAGALAVPATAGLEAAGGTSKLLQWLLPAIARSAGTGTGAGGGAALGGATPKEAVKTGAKVAGLELGGEALAGGSKAWQGFTAPTKTTKQITSSVLDSSGNPIMKEVEVVGKSLAGQKMEKLGEAKTAAYAWMKANPVKTGILAFAAAELGISKGKLIASVIKHGADLF
jgi:hypothetical protein